MDLVFKREGETFLGQCKQWRSFKVGVATAEAEAFASRRNLKLVDGKKLFKLLQQAKAARQAARLQAPGSSRGAIAGTRGGAAAADAAVSDNRRR